VTWRALARIALKTAILFILCNLIFVFTNGMTIVERLSLYNLVVPGRARLPYGENPAESYNLSLDSLPAMLASHTVARPKAADEYRVLLIGDSGIWGWRLTPDATLSAQLTARDLRSADGRRVVVYNLAYPIQALMKDALILDAALAHQPDLVVWFVTLDGFPLDKQTYPPLVARNAKGVRALIAQYELPIDPRDPAFVDAPGDLLARSIVGMRRPLADWLRLQLYGVSWALTGIDQAIAAEYAPLASDLDADPTWNAIAVPRPLTPSELAIPVLAMGEKLTRAAGGRMVIVNEPIHISRGANADVRYNSWYPRWAYDSYREGLERACGERAWTCLDLWDAVPADYFTDSPVHLSPDGTAILADALIPIMIPKG